MTGTDRVAVAVAVIGGAAAILLMVVLFFAYGDEQDPGFTPTVVVDSDFCEGFIAGVAFTNAVLVEGYAFPTVQAYESDVQECLDAGVPSDPVMPFSE